MLVSLKVEIIKTKLNLTRSQLDALAEPLDLRRRLSPGDQALDGHRAALLKLHMRGILQSAFSICRGDYFNGVRRY